MSRIELQDPRRHTAWALAVFGALALAASLPLGPQAALAGAGVLAVSCLVALREMSTPTITWPNALGAFVFLMWFVPARGYRLPVTLPFNLELYRLALGLLLVAFAAWLVQSHRRPTLGGHGAALGVLTAAVVVSTILNYGSIGLEPGDPGAVKAVSYFFGLVAVFVLFMTTIRTHEEIDTVLRAFVLGAAVVALSTVYERRAGFNAFDHLHEWIPVLEREERTTFGARGGNVRVHASAQHPIALACALLIAFPFSLYLSRRASSLLRSRLWLLVGGALGIGAAATVSRTSVIMILSMLVLAFYLRPRQVIRYWPLILVMPFVIHFVVPGALGGLYYAFFPRQGILTGDLYSRPGEVGSGRLADVGPGLRLFAQKPFFGHGYGSTPTTADAGAADVAEDAEGAVIFFDNQYMGSLVSIGAVGIFGLAWFFWGALGGVAKGARRARDDLGDLLTVTAVALAGFVFGMFVFDAFAFVQVTMFAFMLAALGLRARGLARAER